MFKCAVETSLVHLTTAVAEVAAARLTLCARTMSLSWWILFPSGHLTAPRDDSSCLGDDVPGIRRLRSQVLFTFRSARQTPMTNNLPS